MHPEPTDHEMAAVVNTRRDICLNRCPRGEARCPEFLLEGMAERHDAYCPAGAWHEYHYNASRRAVAAPMVHPRVVARGGAIPGTGAILKRMLGRLGIKAAANCACNRRAAEMDAMGPDWCAENIATIVGWLKEEADRRGLPFSGVAADLLVRFSIRIALAKAKTM